MTCISFTAAKNEHLIIQVIIGLEINKNLYPMLHEIQKI